MTQPARTPAIGHNSDGARIAIEVRLFNSLAKFTTSPTLAEKIEVAPDTTVGDLITRYGLPLDDIYLVLRNGRDINAGLYKGGNVDLAAPVHEGDVIAFSGPVPYSPGYGAPVV
jgi:hypothetical protein